MSFQTMNAILRMGRRAQAALAAVLLLGASLCAVQAQEVVYYHTDALGTPVAMTNASGAVIQRREFEPYGRQLDPAVLADGPGFTGHVADAATGLVYMQQRYYDPAIGTFLSTDPVTATNLGDAFNRYWYANANPSSAYDPDGRQPCSNECMSLRASSDGMAGGGIYDSGVASSRAPAQTESQNAVSTPVTPVPMTSGVPAGGFSGPDAATKAAGVGLAAAGALGTAREWGGLIAQIGDGIYPTQPVRYPGMRGGEIAWRIPSSWRILGDYHTHPPGRGSYAFSPRDVFEAERLGWLRYIGFHEQHNIRVYNPATMRPGIRGLPTPGLSAIEARQASYGDVICESCFP